MRNQTTNKKSCYQCRSKRNVDLYLVYGEDLWTCKNCIKGIETKMDMWYGECVICKKNGDKILYSEEDLYEGDDGKLYCSDHRGSGDDPLSDDEVSLIEYLGDR